MKNITATWFEVSVRYERADEKGLKGKVSEQYAVDALTCKEAEDTVVDELKSFVQGDYKTKSVKEAPYKEVFFSNGGNDDRWFKCRVNFVTIDEKTEKERRNAVTYLVQCHDIDGALRNVRESFGGTMQDYEVTALQETKIMDVFTRKL